MKTLPIACALASMLFAPIYGEEESKIPELILSAQGSLKKQADELRLSIGVITKSDSVKRGLKENSIKMTKVIDALKKVGITKEEYQTGRFVISPISEPAPQDPKEGWQPQIIGYDISNTIEVTTSKITILGDLIDAATESGANEITDIRFQLKDPQKYRAEAIALATKNGLTDAKNLAEAAGITLLNIQRIALDQSNVAYPQFKSQPYQMRASINQSAPPIEVQDVEISASVNIIYKIK